MDLLTPEDLAYMRATQADARPTPADLLRKVATRTPTGGQAVTYGPAEPVMVRIDGQVDEVPQTLASRFEGGTAYSIAMDLVLDVRDGDHVQVSPTEVYEVVSDGNPDRWATAQNVYARRLTFPAR